MSEIKVHYNKETKEITFPVNLMAVLLIGVYFNSFNEGAKFALSLLKTSFKDTPMILLSRALNFIESEDILPPRSVEDAIERHSNFAEEIDKMEKHDWSIEEFGDVFKHLLGSKFK